MRFVASVLVLRAAARGRLRARRAPAVVAVHAHHDDAAALRHVRRRRVPVLARRGARRRGPASEARRSLRRRLLARERLRRHGVLRLPSAPRRNIRRRLRPARAGVGRHDKPGGRRSCFARTPRRRRVVPGRGERRPRVRRTREILSDGRRRCRGGRRDPAPGPPRRPDQAQRPAHGARRPRRGARGHGARRRVSLRARGRRVGGVLRVAPGPIDDARSRRRAGARGPGGGARLSEALRPARRRALCEGIAADAHGQD